MAINTSFKVAIKIMIAYAMLFIFSGCSLIDSYKQLEQVSKTIKESKERGVFITNYKIKDLKVFGLKDSLPFENVWEEKSWHLTMGINKNVIHNMHDSSANKIIFKLAENNQIVTNDNYRRGLWFLQLDSTRIPCSILNGMICIDLPVIFENKELLVTMYKSSLSTDFKNSLTQICHFGLSKN